MNRSMPSLPIHHQLAEFTQIYVHRVSDAIQPSHPLLSPSPPAPNPSQHQDLFQCEESTLRMRWPKYWSFSFSISPPNEHPGLISFRLDWLDLLEVQGTHKSLLPAPQFILYLSTKEMQVHKTHWKSPKGPSPKNEGHLGVNHNPTSIKLTNEWIKAISSALYLLNKEKRESSLVSNNINWNL